MKMNLSQNMFTFLYSNTFSFLWGSSSFVKVGLPQLHSVPIIILDFEIVKVFSFQLQLAMVSFSIKVFIFYKNHLQSQLLQLCHPFHLFEKMQLLFQVNVFSIAKSLPSNLLYLILGNCSFFSNGCFYCCNIFLHIQLIIRLAFTK